MARRKRPVNEFAKRPPSIKELRAAENMAKRVDRSAVRDDDGKEIGTVGRLYGMMNAVTEKEKDAQ